jgi:hypothetical protein
MISRESGPKRHDHAEEPRLGGGEGLGERGREAPLLTGARERDAGVDHRQPRVAKRGVRDVVDRHSHEDHPPRSERAHPGDEPWDAARQDVARPERVDRHVEQEDAALT